VRKTHVEEHFRCLFDVSLSLPQTLLQEHFVNIIATVIVTSAAAGGHTASQRTLRLFHVSFVPFRLIRGHTERVRGVCALRSAAEVRNAGHSGREELTRSGADVQERSRNRTVLMQIYRRVAALAARAAAYKPPSGHPDFPARTFTWAHNHNAQLIHGHLPV
jgi:hypothetical protein